MNILAWIIFGALAGWVASMIVRTNDEQGGVMNIFVGIAGAIVGGFIMSTIGGSGFTGFNLSSLLVAVLGAVLLLGIYKLFVGRTS